MELQSVFDRGVISSGDYNVAELREAHVALLRIWDRYSALS
jgi:hypothetical protein